MSISCVHGIRLDAAEGKIVKGFTVVLRYKWSLLSADFSVRKYMHNFMYVVKTNVPQCDNSSIMRIQSCEILLPAIVGSMVEWKEHELWN